MIYQDTLASKRVMIDEPGQSLEKFVDSKEYIVGSGDVLFIVLWDEFQTNYSLKVTPEGTILIPRVGNLFVAGKTLEEVKSQIEIEVFKKYKNIQITITLLNLRKFKVSVTGAIKNPGVYSAYANERVSEVIEKAGGGIENSSTRNIILKRIDGTNKRVDVLRFLRTGENDRNPYVLDGDIIHVPVKDTSIYICGIYGAVKNPGEYEYFEGDSLLDLINLAGGLTVDAELSTVEIVRFNSDNKNIMVLRKDLRSLFSVIDRDENIPILPDDRVFIRSLPEFREKKQVIIKGEVLYPGVYAINEGETKLTDLIQMAGGFSDDAFLIEAEMFREYGFQETDLEFERLKKIPVGDMKTYEYEYFKTKSREKPGRISVDFVRLFRGNEPDQDVMLRDGDKIFIPKKSYVVKISGNVVNSGYLNYEAGKGYLYYIEKAGGFSWRADKGKVKLIKGATGEWVKPNKNIEPGDVIWIPEKPERNHWNTFKDVVAVLSSVATLYLVIDNATR
ncbi:MAG: SLBB domain-containing protein [candidate division Zixibacteria bacterium]|nr:SLBB domain-containing protein [candidate division Zixibacteria bacterium]